MLKITVIILASIVSAVILQDVNHLQNQGEPCVRPGATAGEKQVVPTLYIASQSQPLPNENLLSEAKTHEPKEYEAKIYEPKEYEPKVYEPQIYKQKVYEPQIYKQKVYEPKYEAPNHYDNRRKIYPNPTIQPTSDEIVEKLLRQGTDKITTNDCYHAETKTTGFLDPAQIVDSRRSFNDDGVGNEYKNDYQLENSNEIDDPVSRSDVSPVRGNNKPLLINNPRVCYACSSATNPTCWEPNRRTTIKYCNREHDYCVTKTYGEGPARTMIRDCAASCGDSPIPGLAPMYKTCKICHSDLCNSAFSIKSYKLLYVLLLFTALKFTF